MASLNSHLPAEAFSSFGAYSSHGYAREEHLVCLPLQPYPFGESSRFSTRSSLARKSGPMSACRHHQLVLLPAQKAKVRCRHCHLTLNAEDLATRYCPECFET